MEDREYRSRIRFDQSFGELPEVVVWIQAFDFEKGHPYAINAYADNVNEEGFDMCVEAAHGARLRGAEVSWIAYETEPAGIFTGRMSFDSFKNDPGQPSVRHGVKEKKLGEWQLVRLYAALSKFHCQHGHNMHMAIKTERMDSSFKITAKTWEDTDCRGMEVSYVAVCI